MERGAVQAINLDGGGSSTLVVRRAGDRDAGDRQPAVRRAERPVTNSIQVVSTMPTGPLAVLNVQPAARSVYRNATIDFKAERDGRRLQPGADRRPARLAWSLTAPIGTIDANGHFVATSPGTAQVVATPTGRPPRPGRRQPGRHRDRADHGPGRLERPGRQAAAGDAAHRARDRDRRLPVIVAWDAATDERLRRGRRTSSSGASTARPGPRSRRPRRRPGASSLSLQRNQTYRFQVRAIDKAGNVGAWERGRDVQADDRRRRSSPLGRYVRGTWSQARPRCRFDPRRAVDRDDRRDRPVPVHRHSFAWVGAEARAAAPSRIYVDRTLRRRPSTPTSSTVGRLRSSSGRGLVDAVATPIEFRAVGHGRSPARRPRRLRLPQPGRAPTPPPASPRRPTPPRRPRARRRTADADPATPAAGDVLVGAGDIASCGLTTDTATAKLVAGIGGTVFTAGDNAYETGSAADFAELLRSRRGAPFLDRTFPSPATTSTRRPARAGYFSYFGGRAGPVGAGWYAYDLGTLADLRPQLELLRRRLRRRSARRSNGCARTWPPTHARACSPTGTTRGSARAARQRRRGRAALGRRSTTPARTSSSTATTTTTSGSPRRRRPGRPTPRPASASSWSGTGGASLRSFATFGPTARSATAHARRDQARRSATPATTGSSSRSRARRSRTPAAEPATDGRLTASRTGFSPGSPARGARRRRQPGESRRPGRAAPPRRARRRRRRG